MKKLSEILELAMPSYVEHIKTDELFIRDVLEGKGSPTGNMCFRLLDPLVSELEVAFARKEIKQKIQQHTLLHRYLESKGRKTTALAQIRFYRQWIKELKAEGN